MQPFYDRRRLFAGVIDAVKRLYTVPFIKKIFPKLTTFKYIGSRNGNEINIEVNSSKNNRIEKLRSQYQSESGNVLYVYYNYVIDEYGKPVPKNINEFNNDMNNGIYYNSVKCDIVNISKSFKTNITYYFGDIVSYNGVYYVCKVNSVSYVYPTNTSYWVSTTLPYFIFTNHSDNTREHYTIYEERVANYTDDVDDNYKQNKSINIEFKNVTTLNGYTDPPYMLLAETYDEETGLSGVANLTCPAGQIYKNPTYYSPFANYNNIKSLKISESIDTINIEKTFYGLFRYDNEYRPLGLDGSLNLSGVSVNGFDNCLDLTVDSNNEYFASKLDKNNNPDGILYAYDVIYPGGASLPDTNLTRISYVLPKLRGVILQKLGNDELGDINTIGHSSFAYKTNYMTSDSLRISVSVGSIERCAFAGYSNLKNLYIDSNMETYEFTTEEATNYRIINNEIVYQSGSVYNLDLYNRICVQRKSYSSSSVQRNCDFYVKFENGEDSFIMRGLMEGSSSGQKHCSLYLYKGEPFFEFSEDNRMWCTITNDTYGFYTMDILYIYTFAENIPEGTRVYFSYYNLKAIQPNQDIDNFAFIGCPIEKVVLNGYSTFNWGKVNDVRWLAKDTIRTVIIGCEDDIYNQYKTKSYVIPDTIFAKCTGLECAIINPYINKILSNAFSGCTNLKQVDFKLDKTTNNSLLYSIQSSAFIGCTSLGLNENGKREFYLPDCGTSITVGIGIQIYSYAFANCGTFDIFSTGRGGFYGPNWNTASTHSYSQDVFNNTQIKELHLNSQCTMSNAGFWWNAEESVASSLETIRINARGSDEFPRNCVFLTNDNFKVYYYYNSTHDDSYDWYYGYQGHTGYSQYGIRGYVNLKYVYIDGDINMIGDNCFLGCPLHTVSIKTTRTDTNNTVIIQSAFSDYSSEEYSVIENFYLYCNLLTIYTSASITIYSGETYYTKINGSYVVFTGDYYERGVLYYTKALNTYFPEFRFYDDVNYYTLENGGYFKRDVFPVVRSGYMRYYTETYPNYLYRRTIKNLYIKSNIDNDYIKGKAQNIYYI